MEQDPTNLYFSNLPKDFDERVSYLTKHAWFSATQMHGALVFRCNLSACISRVLGDLVVLW